MKLLQLISAEEQDDAILTPFYQCSHISEIIRTINKNPKHMPDVLVHTLPSKS